MTAEQAILARAAEQVWIGWWRSCMTEVGGTSRLPFDPAPIEQARELATENDEPPPTAYPNRPLTPIVHKGQSEWARTLEGTDEIADVTLSDVLLGLEDYFAIFRRLKKINPGAYAYFRRVGTPLCLNAYTVRTSHLFGLKPIIDPAGLPSYLGLFKPRSKEEHRDDIINDRPTLGLDFSLYEKRRRNVAVAAPWKWTLFDHTEVSLDRGNFTKAERRKWPCIGDWAFHYYIGVAADGAVTALPMQINRHQTLPNGGSVTHSEFRVPPGLKDMCTKPGTTVDLLVAIEFAALRAFAASALSGVQLHVRREKEVARFGIPLSCVRSFFRDRDREGKRRRPLMHLVPGYQYLRNNREVVVGEHLRGTRRFCWRGYDILLTAPGIHHPSPEGLTAETLHDDDLEPLPEKAVKQTEVAKLVRGLIERAPNVPFRRGQPTQRYGGHNLGMSDT